METPRICGAFFLAPDGGAAPVPPGYFIMKDGS